MTDTPLRRLAAGYGEADDQAADQRVADAHRHDPEAEEYLAWRTSDPARWDQLPVQVRIAVGFHESAKQAAQRQGINTSGSAT